ncbi:CoA ester lyase [Asticcacaulis sp. EMRT-3]|uniref:HpcH/HpaI aldolase/citrate lyase family protein n=1 Tax=Asticcacaulis sp. EMRT-3 TaxID=3040349 RepID=UPI0024AFB414|nr:CoA ester lyase [Asticcacaulis sp. EMRT-3]MDI7776059.1 CoA ester lyase [Asticcacaulis sp. EMRT-3]
MIRSALFIPCAHERAVAKAATLACDALIFDLEDAVGAQEREAALKALSQALQGDFVAKTVLVRIHPPSLNAIHKALSGLRLDGLVVPKVGDVEDVRALMMAWPKIPVWAMIETAAGVANLWEIAGLPLQGLIAGPNDLRKSLHTRPMPERADILFALSQIVLFGRAHGLTVLDGVYNAFRDAAGFKDECQQGRSLGFDGKTLIHPDQIAACEAAFSPSEAEIVWARAIVAAFADTQAGVVTVEGEMVERLHLAQAETILGITARS